MPQERSSPAAATHEQQPQRSFTFVHFRTGSEDDENDTGESNIQTINSHIAHVRWRKPLTVPKDNGGLTRTFMPGAGVPSNRSGLSRSGSRGLDAQGGSRLRFRPVAPRPPKKSPPRELEPSAQQDSEVSESTARHNQQQSSKDYRTSQKTALSIRYDALIDFLELQPRLALPIEVSEYEHSLLNFFHSNGGSFKTSKCSPMANHHLTQSVVSRGALTSRVYVNTRIALADYMVSLSRSLPPSKTFYRHLATAQQLTREVLADSNAYLDDKLFGPCNLWAVDASVAAEKADVSHLKIVYDLIDSNGGTEAFRRMRSAQGPPILQPHTLTTCSVFVPYKLNRKAQKTREILQTLIDNLRSIQRWFRDAAHSAASAKSGTHRLTMMRRYLNLVIADCFNDESVPQYKRAGAFYLLFNICCSIVLLQLDEVESQTFLASIQARIQSMGTVPSDLPPSVLSYEIYRIRAGWYGCTEAQKFEIECQLGGMLLNGVKAFSLFDVGTKLQLCRSMLSTLTSVGRGAHELEFPIDQMLEAVEIEV